MGSPFASVALQVRRAMSTVGEKAIENVLRNCFKKARLIQVSDISGGCGAMYRINIESEDFQGLSLLSQHKAVKEVCCSRLSTSL